MIAHKFLLDIGPADLEQWLSPEEVINVDPLPGWHNSIYRVDLRSGEHRVLRVHVPPETPNFIAPTLQIVAVHAEHVPFVKGPFPARTGGAWTLISGRTATLWPYVPGSSGDLSNVTGQLAARCLATIHSAGTDAMKGLLGIRPELWSLKDWLSNKRWSFTDARSFLESENRWFDVGLRHQDLVDQLGSVCDRMPAELGRIDADRMITIPIHGDFYPNNLIADSEGKIVSVIDWDESRIDWRAWDLANALLEFCAGPAGTDFNPACAKAFIREYETVASPLSQDELAVLPLLIRARKLDEFMFSVAETVSFAVKDWEYLKTSFSGWLQVQDLRQL